MEPSPADHRARERHERLVHLVVPVLADAQPLELVHQRQRLLDVPAVDAQAAAVPPQPPGQDRLDSQPAQDLAVGLGIVGPIPIQLLGPLRLALGVREARQGTAFRVM